MSDFRYCTEVSPEFDLHLGRPALDPRDRRNSKFLKPWLAREDQACMPSQEARASNGAGYRRRHPGNQIFPLYEADSKFALMRSTRTNGLY